VENISSYLEENSMKNSDKNIDDSKIIDRKVSFSKKNDHVDIFNDLNNTQKLYDSKSSKLYSHKNSGSE
jgi:hypothetical protein